MENKIVRLIITGLLIFTVVSLFAQEEPDKTLSPYFFVQGGNSQEEQMPLKSTSAEVHIAGVIADVTIAQAYENTGKKVIEAVYVFPASTRAAVYGLTMKVGQRVITAEIQERSKARNMYEQARASGKRASLLEQQRPNVFQMNVANIAPGESIEVELRYTELIVPTEGIYEFVFPAVVGPRYSEKKAGGSNDPNHFLNTPYQVENTPQSFYFDIQLMINAGMPIRHISCESHKIDVQYPNVSRAEIVLVSEDSKPANRDFILQYRLAGESISSGLLLYEGEDENFFVWMVQPPQRVIPEEIPPREYIFIVDVSGSMHGFPLDLSKKLLRDLMAGMRSHDLFNVVLFAGSAVALAPESLAATEANVSEAISVIDNARGGGGTRILTALQKAAALPRSVENLARSIIIATDGYIAVEDEVFDHMREKLSSSNFFPFGIGRSVNRHLIEGMAHVGFGEPFVITNENSAFEQAEDFRKYIESPVLTQVKAQFGNFEVYDVEPHSIPDVLADRPIVVFGKWRGELKGKIKLTGYSGKRKFTETVDLSKTTPHSENSALKYLWAREMIKLHGDYIGLKMRDNSERVKQITDLGLKYNLLTDYTSFVAVDHLGKPVEGDSKRVKQPLPMPSGVSSMAVGFEAEIEGVVRHSQKSVSFELSVTDINEITTTPSMDSLEHWLQEDFRNALQCALVKSTVLPGQFRHEIRIKKLRNKPFQFVSAGHLSNTTKAKLLALLAALEIPDWVETYQFSFGLQLKSK